MLGLMRRTESLLNKALRLSEAAHCNDRQECEQCQNVKLEREVETLSVALEPGMRDGQVRA